MDKDIDDETLVAYADGELPPEMADRVKRVIAADAALAARAALFAQTRRALAEDAAAHPPPPVPDAVRNRIRELAVRGTRPAAMPTAWRPVWQLALAASIALAIGVAIGLLIGGPEQGAPPGLQIAAVSDPELNAALESLPSGQRRALADGGEVAAVATFRNGDAELCREIEYGRPDGVTVVSVACHTGVAWEVRFAVAGAAAGDGYAPASSLEALEAHAASIGAGAAMSPDEERDALSSL